MKLIMDVFVEHLLIKNYAILEVFFNTDYTSRDTPIELHKCTVSVVMGMTTKFTLLTCSQESASAYMCLRVSLHSFLSHIQHSLHSKTSVEK